MPMTGQAPDLNIANTYRAFARLEARGRSPQYEALALAVAEDQMVREFLRSLPSGKRQPNLVFAAARYLLGAAPDIGSLRMLIVDRQHELAAVVQARRTQTNEPARCATLLPALASLPQPLALLEVGASAGLTLLADRFRYDYAGHRITGTDPAAPVLACQPRGSVPLPEQVPVVAWRAGLDINPLDVTNDDDVRWLQCLLWPGEGRRAECLAAAIAVARRDPPPVHRGDLISGLPALAAQAPAAATLVIYHSAVLAYVDPPRRRQFADTVRGLDAVWLSNEGTGVLPHIAMPPHDRGSFVLVRDGTTPVAFTDPHGTWLHGLHGPA
ncbi:MAG TPA: DUF2332 domain-containing protein [Streptosporangiaceae bacterium]|nr:DUF2332 domain-containing protein [Streptosporangiaceae bacterium]